MQALILAAGFATRLHPLTLRIAKPLLPIAERPLIDHIVAQIRAIDEVETIHVVSNALFADDFERWARAAGPQAGALRVWNDGATGNDNRRGAIGDMAWVIEQAELGDDLLVMAGDNLSTFDLRQLRAFERQHGTAIATYREPRWELVPRYSTVETDQTGRVTSFIEKPPAPTTNRVGICCYLLEASVLALVTQYMSQGLNTDAPGYLIAWLHRQVPVYALEYVGEWYDVGDLGSLTAADNAWRDLAGLPVRDSYEL